MIEKKIVGDTGIAVTIIGIGGWQMGGPEAEGEQSVGHGWGGVDDSESIRLIHKAQDLGVNLIDTADIYGNGHSETVIGSALRGRRDQWVIATKGGLVKTPAKRGQHEDVSPDHLRAACEASLHRLQTDYIDFYQLHAPADEQHAEAVMQALAGLKAAGKIRHYGISTDATQNVINLQKYGPVDIVQLATNIRQNFHDCLAYCHASGIGTFIRTPLDWGAAFAKYADAPPQFEPGDFRSGWDANAIRQHNRKGLQYAFLWNGTGRSPAQAALRAVLDKPGVTAVIPGTRKLEHLLDNAAAASVSPLSQEEKARVWEINLLNQSA